MTRPNKHSPGNFLRLGYMRPKLAPEVVASMIEHSERLHAERATMALNDSSAEKLNVTDNENSTDEKNAATSAAFKGLLSR